MSPVLTDDGAERIMRFAELAMRLIQPVDVPGSLGLSNDAHLTNGEAGIPWNIRERIRTIEGLADRIEEELIELVDRLDTNAARAFVEVHWPEG